MVINMKLSVFYDHIKEACEQRNISILEALQIAKDSGISGIEINLTCLLENEETIMKNLNEIGMEISCIYEFYDFGNSSDITYGKEHILAAKRNGADKILVVPGFLSEEEATIINNVSDDYEVTANMMHDNIKTTQMRKALTELTEFAASQNVTVTLEDFDNSTAPFARINQLLWFMKEVPELRFTLDTGNFVYSDESVLKGYEILKPYIVHAHCKDRGVEELADKNALYNRGMAACPTGYGYMPIREIVDNLLHDSYNGYFAIEHFGADDQIDFIKKSAAYLELNG